MVLVSGSTVKVGRKSAFEREGAGLRGVAVVRGDEAAWRVVLGEGRSRDVVGAVLVDGGSARVHVDVAIAQLVAF